MGDSLRCYERTRLWLGAVFCTSFLLPGSSSAQLLNTLPDAPSAVKEAGDSVASLWFAIPTGTPRLPTASPQQQQPPPANPPASDKGLVALIKRGAKDHKEIYSAPFRRQNLKWDALFLLAAGGLIAADKHVTGSISHENLSISQDISDVGLYSTFATTGILYLSGLVRKDEHAREAGFLGFEAFGNTLIVDAATQLITGRERPLEGSGNGRFWVNNAFDSSFPSQHSGLTWSMASVLAHEYPRPWVQLLAYATATTVSVTRVTGLQHFPADLAVGGVFGYLIGRHIFHAHSRIYLKKPTSSEVNGKPGAT